MSAGRYEIFDDGPCVTIKEPCGFSGEYHRSEYADNVLYGAIRQQARDIAELEVFAEIGRQWNTDSSLAKWFPLTADRLGKDAQEIAKLRADLAAAVAERDRLLRNEAGLLNSLKDSHNARFRLEARLAAIEAAPVVHCAWVVINGVNTYAQLIARPAKD